ncbi:OB-fold putative lipoprotein [Niabella sp. CC-SYL272]|uniref:OB-fold putative lipoprotein n=1 Tax=Niabella agricola TaxID=2891571 RepID=UPI001F339BF5|nr:OB-fold putative lipoprotein [Niabella agricola]MCF3110328.1 OB-fold putative lipoprotein [Niabella agricola]
MPTWKKITLAVVVLVVAAILYGWYLYNKKPPDIKQARSQFEITASGLTAAFNADEANATKQYADKIVSVTGAVKEIKIEQGTAATVFLDSGDPMTSVTCSFYDTEAAAVKKLKTGQQVTIKGVCTGKLMDVILNKCSIVQ